MSRVETSCIEAPDRRTLSVMIARELAGRMVDHCRCTGVDMSRAVERALDDYLERCEEEAPTLDSLDSE